MEFEFDPTKSASNKDKHGIDFEEAQAIWDDDESFEVPSRYEGEPRFLVIGKIGGKWWTAICTQRGTKVRLISVRRTRDEEIALYHG